MSFHGTVGNIVKNNRKDRVFSFEWHIHNFFFLTNRLGDRYHSPNFDFCNAKWSLLIYPNGTLQNSPAGWVTLFLCRVDDGPPQTCNVTVGIKGAEGVEKKKGKRQEFSENDLACVWCRFTSLSELREHQSRLVPDNILIITLNVEHIVFPAGRDGSTQTDCSFENKVLTGANESSEKRGCEKALEDFAKLLASGEESDVTVQVSDTEFKVHKLILFARSPALSISLQHESKEKASNRIIIKDCEPEVFREFLHFLYTGSVQLLTERNVFGLYRVADKYLADDLKQQCLGHIQETLSVQTFCDAAKLALTYGESDLLQLAIDFAAENIQSILISAEWQNFNCENPRQANTILTTCFGPRS